MDNRVQVNPTEKSEVEAVLIVLMNQTSSLRLVIDALEVRLKFVLPDIQQEKSRPREVEAYSVNEHNVCPLTRMIEANILSVNDAIQHVHYLLEAIKI